MTDPSSNRASCLALLFLNATIVAFWLYLFWFNRPDTPNDFSGDAYRLYLPNLQYFVETIKAGTVPLWNPYEFAGMPFIAGMEFGPYYPLTWLYFFLPLLDAHLISAVVHMMLLGSFSYLYFRSSLNLRAGPATVGVWIILASAWSVNRSIIYMDEYRSMAYVPLVLLCVDRLLREPQRVWVLLLAFALALQLLAGEVEVSVRTGLLLGPYILMRCTQLRTKSKSWPIIIRRIGLVVVGGALSVGLTAMQWLPMYELVAHSIRDMGSLSYEQAQYKGVSDERLLLKIGIAVSDTASFHYVGGLALLLALYSWRRVRPETLFFSAVLIVAVDFMRGYDSIIAPWYYRLPTGDWFRYPERYIPYAVFALGVLAALATQHLISDQEDSHSKKRRPIWLWLFPVLGIAAWWIWDVYMPAWESFSVGIAALAVGAIHLLVWRGVSIDWTAKAVAGILIAGIVSIPLLRYPMEYVLPPDQMDLDGVPEEIEQYLVTHLQPGERVYTDYLTEEGRFAPKAGLLWKIPTLNGFSPVMPRTFWAHLAPKKTLRDMGNIHAPLEVEVGLWNGLQFAFGDEEILNGFGVAYILLGPNEFLARDGEVPQNYEKVLEYPPFVLWRNPDRLDRAFLITPPAPQTLPNLIERYAHKKENVDIEAYGPQRVALQATCETDSLLVLLDQDFPGWVVEVNGESDQIETVAGSFRGVHLSPGEHRVEFRYAPQSLKLGMAISLSTWLALACLTLASSMHHPKTRD